ncbi:MAG: hypothetical protein ACOCVF_02030 [bacterium]
MFIKESYSSTLDIQKLAKDIIKYLAKYNFQRYKQKKKFDGISGFNLNLLQNKDYGEITQYIKQSDIELHFPKFQKGDSLKAKASYGYWDVEKMNQSFDPKAPRILAIKYNFEKIKNKIHELKTVGLTDIYEIFYESFFDLLTHELQHFFDEFRSEGRGLEKAREIDINKLLKNDEGEKIKYFQLPHEVWARFIQAYNATDFYDIINKNGIKHYQMRDIHTVIKNFIKNMKKFDVLDEKFKRRLIRKIAQFWHYEEDKVSLYNTGKSKHGLLGVVNKNQINEVESNNNSFTNKTLVSVDIQPEYENWFGFQTDDFVNFINQNYENNSVVLLYNGESMGMVSESDYQMWLMENGVDEDALSNIIFFDKGYAFFRYCMDVGIDEDLIIDLVKYMQEHDINDSRDIDEEMWDDFINSSDHDRTEIREILENADDMIHIPELMEFLNDFNNIVVFGGGINECLKEVEIALMALNKPYQKYNQLIY